MPGSQEWGTAGKNGSHMAKEEAVYQVLRANNLASLVLLGPHFLWKLWNGPPSTIFHPTSITAGC